MKKYSILNNPKEKNITCIYIIIFIISVIVTLSINCLIVYLQEFLIKEFSSSVKMFFNLASLLNLLPSVSVLVLFFFLKWLFDTLLWKWKPISYYIGVPNINGEWTGELSSSYDNAKLDMTMNIKQTLTQIEINCIFPNSNSESGIVALDVRNFSNSSNWKMYFSYVNQNNQNDQNDEHIGFNIVEHKMNKSTKKYYLDGSYFTNRPRSNSNDKGTFGKFTLK